MAAKDDMTIPLLPNRYYHIYNRGINKNKIFYNQENFRYFLSKYSQKMAGYFDTFGYCLLDNHFHIFVRVVDREQLLAKAVDDFIAVNQTFYKDYVMPWVRRMKLDAVAQTVNLTNFRNLLNLYVQHGDVQQDTSHHPPDLKQSSFIEQLCSWVVSERFRGFMLGYAKAINKQESRTGSLLQKGFRRKYIPDDVPNKKRVLFYLHHNPIHHFYRDSYHDYAWSSYNTYMTDKQTQLCRSEVMEWFGSKEHFINFGEHYKNNRISDDKWIIDED
jgi:putative transposase